MHDRATSSTHDSAEGKQAALVIAILALLLAFSDIMGSRSSTSEIRHNLDATNLWGQYQAKTTRKKLLETADRQLDVFTVDGLRGNLEAIARLRRTWAEDIDQYESDPISREGRSDLAARAREKEMQRDRAGFANDLFEYASGLLHLAIVLASASVLIERRQLFFGSIATGIFSLGIMLYGAMIFAAVTG